MKRPVMVWAVCLLQLAVSLVPAALAAVAAVRIPNAVPEYRHSIAIFTVVMSLLAVLSAVLAVGLWKRLRPVWIAALTVDLGATFVLVQDIVQDRYSREFHDFAIALVFTSLLVLLLAPPVARFYLQPQKLVD